MKEVYQVMSAMLGQEQRIDQISNNLANVNTVGYKKSDVNFEDYLKMMDLAAGTAAPGQPTNPERPAWPILGSQYTDYSQGAMQTTGQPLDMAIDGEGFFQVQGPADQTLYTRAGNFTLSPAGELVTANGEPVLDDSSRAIRLSPTGGTPQVGSDGSIQQDGAVVGRVAVVRFAEPQRLARAGNSLLAAPGDLQPTAVNDPAVRSGVLEGSNVSAIDEMVRMIETQRAYDVNQKVIQSFDDITQKRISSVLSS